MLADRLREERRRRQPHDGPLRPRPTQRDDPPSSAVNRCGSPPMVWATSSALLSLSFEARDR